MELNKIYCESNLDTMKRIEDCFVDMVVTSPPYDNLRTYTNESEWTFDLFKKIANELYRIIKDGGIIVWIVNDATINGSETGTSFKQALYFKEIGFNLHDTMIWQKDTFSFPDRSRYRQCFEYMFILSKGKPKYVNLIEDRCNKYSGSIVHGTSRGVDGKTFVKSNNHNSFVKDIGVRFNVWNQSSEKHNIMGIQQCFLFN